MKLINSIKTLALAAAAAFGITGAAWGKTVQVTEVSYAALKTAVDGADSGDIIEIAAAGTYQMPTVYPDEGLSIPKNVTIVGTVEGVVFDYSGIPNSTDISFGYVSSGATFSNIEFKLGGIADNYEGIYRGWQKPQPSTGTIVFRDCSFSGIFSIYKAPTVFENCAFKQVTNTYFMWVYDNSTVSFVRCTFNYISKCIHLYNEGGQVAWNVYAEDCKFYPSDPNSSSNKGVFNTKNANPQSVNIILNSCETTDTVHGLVQLEVQSKSNTTIAIGHDIVLDENGDIVSGECSTLVIGSDADPIISSDSDTINNGDGTYTIKNTQSAPTEKEEVQVDVSGTIEATVVDANGNEISATPAQQTAADNKKTATAEAIAANTSAASKTGTGLRNVDESAYLKVELTSTVIEVVDDDASLKTLVFDVTPYKVTETTSDSETTKTEVELTVVDTPAHYLPLAADGRLYDFGADHARGRCRPRRSGAGRARTEVCRTHVYALLQSHRDADGQGRKLDPVHSRARHHPLFLGQRLGQPLYQFGRSCGRRAVAQHQLHERERCRRHGRGTDCDGPHHRRPDQRLGQGQQALRRVAVERLGVGGGA